MRRPDAVSTAADSREVPAPVGTRRSAAFGLAAAAAFALFSLWELWLRPASVDPLPALPALSAPGSLPIAIVDSEASKRCLGAAGFGDHARTWRHLLQDSGHATETVGDAQLQRGLDAYAAIVLPSVVCLGDPARSEVESFLRLGGGVVATWALGARDGDGTWRGYEWLQSLTGAVSFQSGWTEAPWFVSVTTASPLGAGLAGGSRIQVASAERLEATALDADGFWSDARLQPRVPSLPSDYQAAVVRRQVGAGRLVWLGFHEDSPVTTVDAERTSALLRNSVNWAAHRPIVAVEPWPAPHARAVLVAVDVGDYPSGALNVADALLRARVPGTFFLDPAQVKDRGLTEELAAAGELALGWRHADANVPARHILDRMRIDWARLSLWRSSSSWARGVRPFGDVLDAGTSEFLAESGIRYHLAAGGVDSVLPSAMRAIRAASFLAGERSLVGLARSSDDDLHLTPLGLEGLRPEWIASRLLDDSDSVGRLGGLYVLAVHARGLGQPEYLPALRAVLRGLVEARGWIARGGEIAEWWSARSRLRLRLVSSSASVLRLEVVSGASRPIENVGLVAYPEALRGTARVAASGPGPQPRIVVDGALGLVRLTLPRLEPRQTVGITITFDR